MAKKKTGPNKSQAIRDYLKSHPNAGPTEVCNELKKKGLKIAPALVSNVKAALAGRKPGTGRPGRPGRPSKKTTGDNVSMANLLDAKDFADRVGGVDQAQQILKTLGKLS